MEINFQKILLPLSVILFLVFCYSSYFLYNETKRNDLLAIDTDIKWQAEARYQEEIISLNQGIKMIEQEKKEIEEHFVSPSDLVPFLDTLEELALKVGITAETTSVDLSSDGSSLLVGLKTEGNFGSVYKFLTLLENSPYELEFSSVNLSKKTIQNIGGNSSWQAEFGIKLLSFFE